MSRTLKILFIWFCFVFLLTIPFVIISLIVGFDNLDAECDKDLTIRFSTLLFIYACVGILYTIISGICLPFSERKLVSDDILIVFIIVSNMVIIVWNLITSILLFGYSNECKNINSQIYQTCLSILVTQWITYSIVCCLLININCENINNYDISDIELRHD